MISKSLIQKQIIATYILKNEIKGDITHEITHKIEYVFFSFLDSSIHSFLRIDYKNKIISLLLEEINPDYEVIFSEYKEEMITIRYLYYTLFNLEYTVKRLTKQIGCTIVKHSHESEEGDLSDILGFIRVDKFRFKNMNMKELISNFNPDMDKLKAIIVATSL